jgi:hypothetical protein
MPEVLHRAIEPTTFITDSEVGPSIRSSGQKLTVTGQFEKLP